MSRLKPIDPRTSLGLFRWSLAIATGVGLAIRLFRLDHFSYRLDEIIQVRTIQGTWEETFAALRYQALQGPLDYSFGKMLELSRPPDAARRLLPVLWGTATIPVLGLFVVRRAGRVSGAAAAFLLAIAPYHVRYSQEVRPYSLGLFLLCASLLALDRHLERPGPARLAALYVLSLATGYALYVSALVLGLAGGALLVEDALAAGERRRAAARRFLLRSPLFALALCVGYLPWWPTLLKGIRSGVMGERPAWNLGRLGRFISFYGFPSVGWQAPGGADLFFVCLIVLGAVLAFRTPGLRFLAAWPLLGFAVLEMLEQLHPVFDSVFHYLPAGLGLTALSAVSIGWLVERRQLRLAGAAAFVLALALDARALLVYFRQGRADWRPLATFLKKLPPQEPIFTENQYTWLCASYYVNGPRWRSERFGSRALVNLDGEVVRLKGAWNRRQDAWLVLGGPESRELRDWAAGFPEVVFATAEGREGARVKRLTPPR